MHTMSSNCLQYICFIFCKDLLLSQYTCLRIHKVLLISCGTHVLSHTGLPLIVSSVHVLFDTVFFSNYPRHTCIIGHRCYPLNDSPTPARIHVHNFCNCLQHTCIVTDARLIDFSTPAWIDIQVFSGLSPAHLSHLMHYFSNCAQHAWFIQYTVFLLMVSNTRITWRTGSPSLCFLRIVLNWCRVFSLVVFITSVWS